MRLVVLFGPHLCQFYYVAVSHCKDVLSLGLGMEYLDSLIKRPMAMLIVAIVERVGQRGESPAPRRPTHCRLTCGSAS
jgi:hypothetical protein